MIFEVIATNQPQSNDSNSMRQITKDFVYLSKVFLLSGETYIITYQTFINKEKDKIEGK